MIVSQHDGCLTWHSMSGQFFVFFDWIFFNFFFSSDSSFYSILHSLNSFFDFNHSSLCPFQSFATYTIVYFVFWTIILCLSLNYLKSTLFHPKNQLKSIKIHLKDNIFIKIGKIFRNFCFIKNGRGVVYS